MTSYVYIMTNKPRGTLYIGVTSDLEDRVWEHKNKYYKGFSSKYNLNNLAWFEMHPNIVLAIQREKSLKRYPREWKLNLIEAFNPSWTDLGNKIDSIENVYMPHLNDKAWDDYN